MTTRKMFLIGFVLMCTSFVFAFAETWYFGWNDHPESKAEMFCDRAAGAVCSIGTLMACIAVLDWGYAEYVEIKKKYR